MAFWFTDMLAQIRSLDWERKLAARAFYGEDSPNGLTDEECAARLYACLAAVRWLRSQGPWGLGTKTADRKKAFEFIVGAIKSPPSESGELKLNGQVIAFYEGGMKTSDFIPCLDT